MEQWIQLSSKASTYEDMRLWGNISDQKHNITNDIYLLFVEGQPALRILGKKKGKQMHIKRRNITIGTDFQHSVLKE